MYLFGFVRNDEYSRSVSISLVLSVLARHGRSQSRRGQAISCTNEGFRNDHTSHYPCGLARCENLLHIVS